MKLLIEHNGGLGDAILDTAFLKKLKEKHPEYEIDLFTYFDNAEIFYSASYLKTIIPAPKNYNHINNHKLPMWDLYKLTLLNKGGKYDK